MHQVLGDAMRRMGGGLSVALGSPARIQTADWQSLPVADWLAMGQEWALVAVKATWAGGFGRAWLGVSRSDLPTLGAPGAHEPGAGADADGRARVLGSLGEALGLVVSGMRCQVGKPECQLEWSREEWDLAAIQELDPEALGGEAVVSSCTICVGERTADIHAGFALELALELAAGAPAPAATPAPRPKVVAVMAFDPRVRRELREAAKSLGAEVAEFVDLRDYMQARMPRRTRAILLGVSLENHTALEHCRALRQEKSLEAVPILMCAPTATKELLLQSIAAGAQAFAVAPFSNSIPAKLQKLLEVA
ncbi:MAG: hypothetical protein HZB25_13600 [Candidatus Eisenbacteria bacterium]|nr:hypothetical protein [Candidatus Eisenbacteria bacterium]